jgi:hypothetical protein
VPRYGEIDRDYAKRLRSTAADGPIYMLGLTSFLAASAGKSGDRDPATAYAPIPILASAGAVLCFAADVLASTGGWDRVAVIGYPSRKAFVDLAYRADFQAWHVTKEDQLERTTVLGTLPVGGLPGPASHGRMLLEAWAGAEPAPVTAGLATGFTVEGTVFGDGRRWSGVRYTPIEPGVPLPLQEAAPGYQALLLEPTIERWR